MPETTAALCTGLLTALQQRLTADEFLARHRQSAQDFTRARCLPFVVVVVFRLNLVKRALQDELDEFFNLESGAAVAPQVVTQSAFCQARLKLKAEAFGDTRHRVPVWPVGHAAAGAGLPVVRHAQQGHGRGPDWPPSPRGACVRGAALRPHWLR